ncbi:DNA-3-methyladenine glycosylase I [Haematospirillum sp. H1815]|uniref:DNA-3-methyladenine glycosylase I n=1 Tax=Haematospirillum sp. H1815 TaxID=2723108 RepID=UPI0014399B73|nr:DNA-3-methyladenine glycosylase I [Haematospirillum sp. H1815]NKD76495.1 DNA-3-methyladenine glycosylase I [Haematospirillum sp. H1815]
MSWYCDLAPGHPVHHAYHESEYGFPLRDDQTLLERLSLEIFQAGLSWELILKRRTSLKEAFAGFDPHILASWNDEAVPLLLQNPGIIRNRRKVEAILENARILMRLKADYGSLANWIDAHHPLVHKDWVRVFRRTFRFTGPEIVKEFLMSTGWLPGAHHAQCPVYTRILAANPPWRKAMEHGFSYD